jgi:NTP pyrophosphatase (non-canonical NTP hydrolase)
MRLNEYQERAMATAIYPGMGTAEGLSYSAPALAAEAGEVSGHYAKSRRDDKGVITAERRAAMLKECGDTLWEIAAVVTDLGSTLEEVAAMNLEKLASRQQRGTLGGSGDKR